MMHTGLLRPVRQFFLSRHRSLTRTFQSFWAGKVLSPYEVLCLRSFIDHGYSFDLYTFEKNLKAPRGVRVRDAAEILSPDEFFVYEDGIGKGSPAAFANLFRYRLLAEKGGWWVDTDVLCLSDKIPPFKAFFAAEDEILINTAVLFFERHDPLMIRSFEEAKRMGRKVRWGDTGPYLFTRLVKELGYQDQIVPTALCYPVHHSKALDVLRPSEFAEVTERTENSLFVHLYNASLQLKNVQKMKAPPAGSALAFWARRHAVGGWHGAYDESGVEQLLAVSG
jgi:hypothetical protein